MQREHSFMKSRTVWCSRTLIRILIAGNQEFSKFSFFHNFSEWFELPNIGEIEGFWRKYLKMLHIHFQNLLKFQWKNENLENSWFPAIKILISVLEHQTVLLFMKLCSLCKLHNSSDIFGQKSLVSLLGIELQSLRSGDISSISRFCGGLWEAVSPSSG